MAWDTQTAQKFATKFDLEVLGFSRVKCASWQEANKLLSTFGYRQVYNDYYCWKMGQKTAVTRGGDGMIVFRRRPTSQERRERKAWLEAWEERGK